MATHSSVLAWRIPGKVEPGGQQSMGSHRVGHDWSDLAATAAVALQWQPENRVQARVGISGKNVRRRRNFAVSDFPCHSVRLRCQSSFSTIRDKFTQPCPYGSGPVGLPPLKSTAQPGSKPGSGRHLLITFPSCTLRWDGTLFFFFPFGTNLSLLNCPRPWAPPALLHDVRTPWDLEAGEISRFIFQCPWGLTQRVNFVADGGTWGLFCD